MDRFGKAVVKFRIPILIIGILLVDPVGPRYIIHAYQLRYAGVSAG